MVDLTEEGRRVIEALIGATVAWQSAAELASATGFDIEETTDLLATLDADGWLSAWEREPDVVVTLSVEASSRLAVRLVEAGRDEVPRWARLGDPEPPSPKASGVFRGDRAAGLELVVDPALTAEEVAERAEEEQARSAIPTGPRERVLVDRLPAPTLFLGLGLTPWPGPGETSPGFTRGSASCPPCPSCRSKRLGPSTYCLYCDRWGLDHLLADVPAVRVRPHRSPKDDADRRELERQARKTKRRARRFAQSKFVPGPKHARRALP